MNGLPNDIRDRLAGAVGRHLVGDAMGMPYEFLPPDAIGKVRWGHRGTHGQPPGTWSDDGGLMLALLDSLLSAGFDLEDQGRRALRWLDGPGLQARRPVRHQEHDRSGAGAVQVRHAGRVGRWR